MGVNWSTGNQKWKAQIKVDGKQTHLGYFDVQEAAARKYDAAASQAGKPVNFPSLLDGASQQEQHPTPTTTTTRALQVQVVLASVANVANKRGTSKYKGVAWSKKSLKWQVEIRLDGKSVSSSSRGCSSCGWLLARTLQRKRELRLSCCAVCAYSATQRIHAAAFPLYNVFF